MVVLSILLALSPASRAETDGKSVLDAIRSATLDPASAVSLRDVDIDMGLGRLEIVEGRLFPAAPVSQRVFEAVFLGDARFVIEPPDAIEAGQLDLFTKQESLEVEVQKAVLVFGSSSVSERLLQRAAEEVHDEQQAADAAETFEAWVSGAERRGFGTDAAILKAALGDAAHQGYFAALMYSGDYGRFQYILDPSELEQVTLGQFVPFEMDDREKYRVERSMRREKRRGRSIQTRIEDLGDWNTWIQTSLRDEQGNPRPESVGFEPQQYTIDVSLDPKELKISGRVEIDAVAYVGGRRAVTLELSSDLKPSSVRDVEGNDPVWFRSGSDLHVVLEKTVNERSRLRLEIEYDGVILDELEPGVFRLRDTYAWYPHIGTIDRATYRTTIRYPKKFTLLASGNPVEDRTESGVRIETRVLDVPAFAFTFEVGDFEVVEEQVGHVKLTVGFSKSTLVQDAKVKPEVVETLKEALVFYEETFGAYPLDYLTVATIPRGFSQGFLSCITLSHYLIALPKCAWVIKEGDGSDHRQDRRIGTISHELAHQWWGNKVGWYSYRDQWLSEALADYSSVVFTSQRAGKRPVYLAEHAKRWKRTLSRTAGEGRIVESIGPVVLGQRLYSSISRTAYTAVVYDKGSVVCSMLARAFGQNEFNAMLKALADRVENRAVSTETFLKSLEHMSGLRLQAFADEFVCGTGVPEVYYSFRFAPAEDGQWVVSGEARQVSGANYRYKLFRTETNGWDVSRERAENVDISTRAFVVPFQIALETKQPKTPKKKGLSSTGYETGRGLGGNLVIQGERSEFSFKIKERPRDFFLDQRGEVLAYFFCESREPKRMLHHRAMELSGDDAEAMYLKALSASLLSEQARGEVGLTDKELEKRARLEDARIHLSLAQLYLDQQRDVDALREFEAAEELFNHGYKNRYEGSREILESRLEARRGEYKAAWERLSRTLRLSFPRMSTDTVANDLRRNKWRTGRRRGGDGEDYAVLAVTAFETGHEIVARQALEQAEERGADMTALKRVLGS